MQRSKLRETRRLVAGAWRVLRRDGARGVARRAARFGYFRLGGVEMEFPLKPGDVMTSSAVPRLSQVALPLQAPLTVGWVMAPPSAGSGGHTTAFRAIEALEGAGHRCVIYLYDRFDGDLNRQTAIIRTSWPSVRAEVRRIEDGVNGVNALVATSWQSAHLVARHAPSVARCFYFVQDYEPYFYPHGAEYSLAEDTYLFGFYGITAGRWLSKKLESDFKMPSTYFDFGADTKVYKYDASTTRDGIAFYAKPGVPRRGYQIGLAALSEFARLWPSAKIHLYGDPVTDLPFSAISHGRVSPVRLNDIYNRCRTGLSLSFTNVSLIPFEMLACGVVPVVNDADHNRAVLDAPGVRWSEPTWGALAEGLSTEYARYSSATGGRLGSQATSMSWDTAMAGVVRAVERECGIA